MLQVIQEIVRSITGIDNITMETDFIRDLALNSFDIVNIICAFERRFGIEIPVRDVWNLNQVKDVIEYLEARGVAVR
jgi:acyl carrier protein